MLIYFLNFSEPILENKHDSIGGPNTFQMRFRKTPGAILIFIFTLESTKRSSKSVININNIFFAVQKLYKCIFWRTKKISCIRNQISVVDALSYSWSHHDYYHPYFGDQLKGVSNFSAPYLKYSLYYYYIFYGKPIYLILNEAV